MHIYLRNCKCHLTAICELHTRYSNAVRPRCILASQYGVWCAVPSVHIVNTY